MSTFKARLLESVGLREATRAINTRSMWPLIRPGDSIRFRRSSGRPRIGEIWVADRGDLHLAHRVLFVRRDRILLKGDWNLRPDRWLPRSALFGPVFTICHRDRWRRSDRLRDRLLGLALGTTGSAYHASRLATRRAAAFLLGEARALAVAAALRRLGLSLELTSPSRTLSSPPNSASASRHAVRDPCRSTP